jgi:hypothetical protein
MSQRVGLLAAVLAVALTVPGAAAVAGHAKGKPAKATTVFTLVPSTHGNPEGVAAAGNGRVFYVGATGDGTIYKGTIGTPTVTELIPGGAGRSAVGLKVRAGRLYVAGGATGKIFVYDLATKGLVATFDTGAGGFLNDLVVTPKGDVFVTDSFRPTLWHVTGAQVAAGSGAPAAVPVGPEIAYAAGFNLNGIVLRKGGRQLLVVQSNTGMLFRIQLGSGPGGRTIRRVSAPPLVGGDGLLLDNGRLVVVRGAPASLTFVKLLADARRAKVTATRTDPTLRGPSTVARARSLYLVVNADFATGTTPFTVSALPRRGDH